MDMTCYKFTDSKHQTYGQTQWRPGVTHSGTGQGGLCGPGWIHAYTDPDLAVLFAPANVDFKNPVLWRCEGIGESRTDGLKIGYQSLTTLEIIPTPEWTTEDRVKFAIYCALEVYKKESFVRWAKRWLSGKGRSAEAAWAETWGAPPIAAAALWSAWEMARAQAARAARKVAWVTVAKSIDFIAIVKKVKGANHD